MMAQRLRQARIDAGFPSAAAAAEARGWTTSTFTSHENGTRGFGIDDAKRYARAFKVNPGWLLALDQIKAQEVDLVASEGGPKERLTVRGPVAAGIWREQAEWPADEWYEIEVGPPPFRGAERFAVRMEGFSMDKTIPPGSDLECLRIQYGVVEPQAGDLVVVERQNHDLTEMTCKRLDRDGEDWVLRAESTKAEFQTPIKIGRPDVERHDDNEVRVIGIVLNSQQRHFRKRH